MNTNIHDLDHQRDQVIVTHGTLHQEKENPILMVLLILVSSFILGSIPFIFGLTLPSSQMPTVPHQGILWSPLGK